MDILNLWESFSDRVATIYLPDRKRPMIPTCLSECLCSLQESRLRFAFCLDFIVKGNEIQNVEFKNTLIKVKKNYIYEEEALLKNKSYKLLKKYAIKLGIKYKYMNNCETSNDIIAYYMVFNELLLFKRNEES